MGNADSKDIEEFEKITQAKSTKCVDLFNKREFTNISELFTKDCRYMPAGFPIQIGTDGFADFSSKMTELGFHKVKFVQVETIGPVNDVGCVRTEYSVEDDNGKEISTGKCILIWKKEDGEWKCHVDIWNPDHLDLFK